MSKYIRNKKTGRFQAQGINNVKEHIEYLYKNDAKFRKKVDKAYAKFSENHHTPLNALQVMQLQAETKNVVNFTKTKTEFNNMVSDSIYDLTHMDDPDAQNLKYYRRMASKDSAFGKERLGFDERAFNNKALKFVEANTTYNDFIWNGVGTASIQDYYEVTDKYGRNIILAQVLVSPFNGDSEFTVHGYFDTRYLETL